jgi:hypothetical protein
MKRSKTLGYKDRLGIPGSTPYATTLSLPQNAIARPKALNDPDDPAQHSRFAAKRFS